MRAVALCLLEHQNRLLLQEFWHEYDHRYFYRPPGGGIELGERALDAVCREMQEELDTRISNPQLVNVLENIFTYGGETRHEIVFLYRVTALEERLTRSDEIELVDNGTTYRAVWKPIEELIEDGLILYPVDLRKQLTTMYAQ